jgi:hypothetical protein
LWAPVGVHILAAVESRPGTAVVAGALRGFAVLTVVGAVVGVAAFRAELLKLVPFVGATGLIPPLIFAAMVVGLALLFWGMADGLSMLAAQLAAHAELEEIRAAQPAPRPTVVAPSSDRSAGVGDVPGFQRYNRPLQRAMKWTANVTNGPAYLAKAVCEVAAGDPVIALGEVAEFVFVESPNGNGWLPKDALKEQSAA